MDILTAIQQNPPLETETTAAYSKRLSNFMHITPTAVVRRMCRLMKKNRFREGINGVREFLSSGIQSTVVEKNEIAQDFDWREATFHLQGLQKQFGKSKRSTNYPKIKIDTTDPICVVLLADLHMCSWGTDYELFKQITDELIHTEGLYTILAGDLLQMAIKLRGVLEVSDNALPPKWQMAFLDSWLKEVHHKVLFSTWDNHSVMREENQSGISMYAHIFENHGLYSNGIAHADLEVGKQLYKIAASHFFRGRSMYNPVHGQIRYSKWEGQDRDILMAGDSHVPGVLSYTEGGREKLAMNCGTLQTNSGYAKRFFSLTTHPKFPCVVLFPDEFRFVPFNSVADWLRFRKGH